MPNPLSLSPSKLSILKECPRCFYDAVVLHVARPRGAFPSLPGGMDLIVKAYVDQFRGALPPQLQGRVPGVLYPDLAVLRRLRNWRSGLSVSLTFDVRGNSVGVKLIGALDDLLVVGSQYAPLDTKTKGGLRSNTGSTDPCRPLYKWPRQVPPFVSLLVPSGQRVLDQVTPLTLAPARFAPTRLAPVRLAPFRFAPLRFAPARSELARVASVRFPPLRFAPARVAPVRLVSFRFAAFRFAPAKLALAKSAPLRLQPARFAPQRVTVCPSTGDVLPTMFVSPL